jgi:peroxiredoxin
VRKLLYHFVFVIIFNTTTRGQKPFELIGNVKNYVDSTELFLDITSSSGKNTIRTYVINDKFVIKGNLTENAELAILHTKDFVDYSYFWLEPNTIFFTASKGKFKKAIINGSKTQLLEQKLNNLTENVNDTKNIEVNFIKENPNSIISARLLNVYSSTWGKKLTTELYNILSVENKKTFYCKKVIRFIELNKEIKVGKQFENFSQLDTSGKVINLSESLGKLTLLDFWGSWCGPCRENNFELSKLYNEFKNKGFEIFSVGVESDKIQWINAIRKDKLVWKNVSDLKGNENEAALIYGVNSYPTNFLIDKSGKIIAKDISIKKLRQMLLKLPK